MGLSKIRATAAVSPAVGASPPCRCNDCNHSDRLLHARRDAASGPLRLPGDDGRDAADTAELLPALRPDVVLLAG